MCGGNVCGENVCGGNMCGGNMCGGNMRSIVTMRDYMLCNVVHD